MPRFHFNVYDGVALPDPVGRECDDWHGARQEAIRRLGEIVLSRPIRNAMGEDWRMEVTDESGLIVFRLDFSVPRIPATVLGESHESNGP